MSDPPNKRDGPNLVAVQVFFALAHRDHTAMSYFADDVLELNRGVVNAEVST